jgi:hypothetical protein
MGMTAFWSDQHGNGVGLFVLVWLTAFTPLILIKAAFRTWGRHVISASSGVVTVFSGIGNFGLTRQVDLSSLPLVLLRTRHGRRGSVNEIVLIGDREVSFGGELNDEQRRYIAVFIILKQRSLGPH